MEIINEPGYDGRIQYIVVDGKRYDFDTARLDEYTLKDAEMDAFRASAATAANIELAEPSYRKISKEYTNLGIMPNGNFIVKDSKRKYGVFDSDGNIVIPFIYDKIEAIRKYNGEIVHDDFYIIHKQVEAIKVSNGEVWSRGPSKVGIISSNGENERMPFRMNYNGLSYFDHIRYNERDGLLYYLDDDYYKGVYAQGGFAGFENVLTINPSELEQYCAEKHIDRYPLFTTKFKEFLKKYINETSFWNNPAKIDTNVASQLLNEVNYLIAELNKMDGLIARDEQLKLGMFFEKIASNLKNYKDFQQPRSVVASIQELEEMLSEVDRKIELDEITKKIDAKIAELDAKEKTEQVSSHNPVEQQKNDSDKELPNDMQVTQSGKDDEKVTIFINAYNMLIGDYEKFLVENRNGINIDINKCSKMIEGVDYLLYFLKRIEMNISREDYVKYSIQLKRISDTLTSVTKQVKQASSIFGR